MQSSYPSEPFALIKVTSAQIVRLPNTTPLNFFIWSNSSRPARGRSRARVMPNTLPN